MALATALELGIELENKVIDVFEAKFLDAINPIRQIPTLLLDDGRAIYDSRVITSYFCSLRPARRLNTGDWDLQTRWYLAVGLMESSVQWVMELLRPEGEQSATQIEKCDRRISKVIDKLECMADEICGDQPRIDRLATAIALEYIDFRIKCDWRDKAPRLDNWLVGESSRPCMTATRPKPRS